MTTNCHKCERTLIEKENEKYCSCPNCHCSTPKGVNNLKGGEEMVAKKTGVKTEPKTEVVSQPEKKMSITENRVANAKKVMDLLNSIGLDKKEQTATLSRAYGMIRQSM